MDISETTQPKSDQLNADDLIGGPETVTIIEVRKGSPDQPVNIVTDKYGPDRPFKPAKTVRRVLLHAWGKDTSVYAGRRITIFRDEDVKWAGKAVGGIRISHMSDIPKRLELNLTEAKGSRRKTVIEPLGAAAPDRDWAKEIESATTTDELRELWKQAPPSQRAAIQARRAEVEAPPVPESEPNPEPARAKLDDEFDDAGWMGESA